jgi:Flp pilus assembly protein TadD
MRVLRLLLPCALLAAPMLAGFGCAKSGDAAKRPEIQEPDPWETPEGRERVRLELARAMLESGDAVGALGIVAQARAEGSSGSELDLLQARGFMLQALNSEAERMLLDVQRALPRDPRVPTWLGVIYADTGRVPEAIESFERAVKLDDASAQAWNNLGFLLMSQRSFPEAIEALQRAVELDPMQVKYRNNLAFSLAASGRLAEALQLFGTTSAPADAHANLALALELGGDRTQALVHYQHALVSDPNNTAANAGIQRLNTSRSPEQNP